MRRCIFRLRGYETRMIRPILLALLVVATVARAELKFDKPLQEFHRVPDDGHVEAHFTFKNAGAEPVKIRRVVTSCGCTTATLAKNTFAPGEAGEIVVKFTFGSRRGPHRKIIGVTLEDKTELPLDLRVWIHEPLTVTPALVYWKVGEPGGAKPVQLTVADGQKVGVKSVTSSNPRITATVAAARAGEQYVVSVKPADTAQKESAELTVQTDFPPDAPRAYTIHARIK